MTTLYGTGLPSVGNQARYSARLGMGHVLSSAGASAARRL